MYINNFVHEENKYCVGLLLCADPGANSWSRLLVVGLIIRRDRCYSAGPGTVQKDSLIYIYIYTYICIYQISYIQYGNIPIRDSPHPTPPHAGAVRKGAVGGGMGWGGVGRGESLVIYFHIGQGTVIYI